jgi:hypothetical protein
MESSRMQRCREWAKTLSAQIKSPELIQKVTSNPKVAIYGPVLLCLTTWLLIRIALFLKKPQPSRPATPDLEKPAVRSFKAPERKPGGQYPHPET